MKKIILILLVAALSVLEAYSQGVIPGFKGKRFLLELNLSAIPAIAGPTANNYGDRTFGKANGDIGLSSRIGLSAHYAIGRHTNAFLGYNYLKTGYIAELQTPALLPTTEDHSHRIFGTLAANTVEAGFDFVLSPAIYAPLGGHIKLGAYYTMANAKVIDKLTFTLYESSVILNNNHNPLGLANTVTDFGVVTGYGNRGIISKYITFSWGFSFYMRTSQIKSFRQEEAGYLGYNKLIQQDAMRKRLGVHSSFLLDFSIGYLLF